MFGDNINDDMRQKQWSKKCSCSRFNWHWGM